MPQPDRKTITLQLPPDLLEQIETTARHRVLGRNLLIELLLRRALHDLPELPERP